MGSRSYSKNTQQEEKLQFQITADPMWEKNKKWNFKISPGKMKAEFWCYPLFNFHARVLGDSVV